ncbi:hypothetical protein RDV64_21015 [Acuticoccus sp. MNP-M23]|uniref:hypothetical protein n=1 Tax=Acuticoccus sp. MNP-M23 TaxID=3072793 RepID=UPI002815020C|nr:hypothetical protein [Acuticoccus sp. MNP-M23]WMS42514.1 hypothetical protein RDV64_21015 [Acuticoccus sp. MNP-M23]
MDAQVPFPGSGGGGGDGNGEGGVPKAFAVGYRPHTGDMMVYGGAMMTLVGVLAAVVHGSPVFFIASIVGSLCALYFHPTLDLNTPQLGADTEGIFIARFGMIPWSEIAEIGVRHRALRTMHLSTLIVQTRRPLKEAIAVPDRIGLLGRLCAANARRKGGAIHVTLHTLGLPADAIGARLAALQAASH